MYSSRVVARSLAMSLLLAGVAVAPAAAVATAEGAPDACRPWDAEPNDVAAQAAPLGDSVEGLTCGGGDVDWFVLPPAAVGDAIVLDLDARSGGRRAHTVDVARPDGTIVALPAGPGSSILRGRQQVVADVSGRWLVRVSALDPKPTARYGYVLTAAVQEVDCARPGDVADGDVASAAVAFPQDVRVRSSVCDRRLSTTADWVEDLQDYWSFGELGPGDSVMFNVNGSSHVGYEVLLDGVPLTNERNGSVSLSQRGAVFERTLGPGEQGLATMRMYLRNSPSSVDRPYSFVGHSGLLACPNDDAYEPNDGLREAAPIAGGASVINGVLCPADGKDVFVFDTALGEALIVASGLPTVVTDGDGIVIYDSKATYDRPLIGGGVPIYQANVEGGPLFVSLYGDAPYQASVRAESVDCVLNVDAEPNDVAAQALTVRTNAPLRGNLCDVDRVDWYRARASTEFSVTEVGDSRWQTGSLVRINVLARNTFDGWISYKVYSNSNIRAEYEVSVTPR